MKRKLLAILMTLFAILLLLYIVGGFLHTEREIAKMQEDMRTLGENVREAIIHLHMTIQRHIQSFDNSGT